MIFREKKRKRVLSSKAGMGRENETAVTGGFFVTRNSNMTGSSPPRLVFARPLGRSDPGNFVWIARPNVPFGTGGLRATRQRRREE